MIDFHTRVKWSHFLLLGIQKKPSIRCPAYLAVSGKQFRNATVALRRSHGNAFQIHPKAIGRGARNLHLIAQLPLITITRFLSFSCRDPFSGHQLRD